MWLKKEEKEQLEDGELPFGWVTRNKKFVSKIEKEYTRFLNSWINAKAGSKEKYAALSSFIRYLETVEKMCKIKGECFEFWFYEILAPKDYIEKRKKELEDLKDKL